MNIIQMRDLRIVILKVGYGILEFDTPVIVAEGARLLRDER